MSSRAVIQHISRRTWAINVIADNWVSGPGWNRHSRAAAERKAKRELARYRRRYENLDDRLEIR